MPLVHYCLSYFGSNICNGWSSPHSDNEVSESSLESRGYLVSMSHLTVYEMRRIICFFDELTYEALGERQVPPMEVSRRTAQWCVQTINRLFSTGCLQEAWKRIYSIQYIGHVSNYMIYGIHLQLSQFALHHLLSSVSLNN